MRILALLCTAFALSGCAMITTFGNRFEGGATYTVIPVPLPSANAAPPTSALGQRECTTALPCVSLASNSPFQAYPSAGDGAKFFNKETDKIQISLKTGTIGWFSEGAEQRLLNNLINPISHSPLKGEIALVANVTEGVRQPGSLDQNGKLEGRVVFYSGDIYKGQRLNEFNVPIYGPATYAGGPLTVDLWVMELDRAESEQMGAVLSTLASIGRSIPAIGTGSIDLLSQIGTSFLKSNDDDIIGHFTVTLMPPTIGVQAADPILQVSDIIIRRSEIRTPNLSLANCYYQPLTGRIFGDQTSCENPLDNFLVLAVRKSTSATNIAPTLSFDQLQERLAKAPEMSSFNSAMSEFADKVISNNAQQLAFANLDRLKDAGTSAVIKGQAANDLVQQLQCSLLAARGADDKLVQDWCMGAKARQMPMTDFDKVTRRLVEISCVEPSQISPEALLGPKETAKLEKADLQSAKGAMVSKVAKVRPTCPT